MPGCSIFITYFCENQLVIEITLYALNQINNVPDEAMERLLQVRGVTVLMDALKKKGFKSVEKASTTGKSESNGTCRSLSSSTT